MENKTSINYEIDNDANRLLSAILKSIYWVKFTPNQQTVITNIIKDSELDNMMKADEICEFLGIGKRDNRSSIITVLNGYQLCR